MRARIVSGAASPRHSAAFCAYTAACVACVLLGCDAEAHIRLLEPNEDATELDASRPVPPQPEAGVDVPTEVPDTERPDPQTSDPQTPEPQTPDVPDSEEPPPASLDGGSEQAPPAGDSLVLRYDFAGDGDVVPDLVGDRDARLLGGTLLDPSRAFIDLDGVDDYVDFPNGVVSVLRSATFVVWLSWTGGACWQRIFDFGISDQGEDQVGNAETSLFMTPRACGDDTFTVMAEIEGLQHPVSDDEALPTGYAMQVALVVDGDTQTLTLYRDTEQVGEAPAPFSLDQLDDDNNWLGRSQWVQDRFFSGAIGEFRIYSRALGATELAEIRAEGFATP